MGDINRNVHCTLKMRLLLSKIIIHDLLLKQYSLFCPTRRMFVQFHRFAAVNDDQLNRGVSNEILCNNKINTAEAKLLAAENHNFTRKFLFFCRYKTFISTILIHFFILQTTKEQQHNQVMNRSGKQIIINFQSVEVILFFIRRDTFREYAITYAFRNLI